MGRVSPDNKREKESQTQEGGDAPSRESRVEIKARGQTVDDDNASYSA